METNSAHGYTDNELIAEFMGLHFHKVGWVDDTHIDGNYECEKLKYNYSWEELMPVVEKIGKIMNDFEKEPFYELEEPREILMSLGDCLCQVDIWNANKKVVEFIKWYNNRTRCNECKTPHFCNSNIDRPCVINQQSK